MELDLTVSLNLKCEDIQDIVTPFIAESKPKLKIRVLPKGVEINSLSMYFILYNDN